MRLRRGSTRRLSSSLRRRERKDHRLLLFSLTLFTVAYLVWMQQDASMDYYVTQRHITATTQQLPLQLLSSTSEESLKVTRAMEKSIEAVNGNEEPSVESPTTKHLRMELTSELSSNEQDAYEEKQESELLQAVTEQAQPSVEASLAEDGSTTAEAEVNKSEIWKEEAASKEQGTETELLQAATEQVQPAEEAPKAAEDGSTAGADEVNKSETSKEQDSSKDQGIKTELLQPATEQAQPAVETPKAAEDGSTTTAEEVKKSETSKEQDASKEQGSDPELLEAATEQEHTQPSVKAPIAAQDGSAPLAVEANESKTPDRPIEKQESNGLLRPLDCDVFLDQVHAGTHPIVPEDPNRGENITVLADKTTVPFWVSLFPQSQDPAHWKISIKHKYFEGALGKIWTEILLDKDASPAGSRVLDVGGSIGYYSLLSASLGNFVVDAFEPALTNGLRFCESLALNHWKGHDDREQPDGKQHPKDGPKVTIYPYGLADKPGQRMFYPSNNPGEGKFIPDDPLQAKQRKEPPPAPVTVDVSTLDTFARQKGWFQQSPPHIAILKISVKGYEPHVLLGARELINSKMVHNIFTKVTPEGDKQKEVAVINMLLDAGYELKGMGRWVGPANPSKWPNDKNLADRILETLLENPDEYLNLWWGLDSGSTKEM